MLKELELDKNKGMLGMLGMLGVARIRCSPILGPLCLSSFRGIPFLQLSGVAKATGTNVSMLLPSTCLR